MREINKVLYLKNKDFNHIKNMLEIGKFQLEEFLGLIDLNTFKVIQLEEELSNEDNIAIYNNIINSFNVSPLLFLGIGSAFNPNENNNSAMIKTGKHLLLIDCGESTFKTLIKNNVLDDVENIDIVITHLHSDHTGSLSTLLYYLFFIKNVKANVHFPNDDLKKLLDLLGNNKSQYNYNVITNEVKLLNNLLIKPFKTKHCEELNSFGYEIIYNNRTIIYNGDSSELPKDINKRLLTNENITLYQDVSLFKTKAHFYYKELIKNTNKNVINKVFAMHLDNSKETFNKLKEYGFNIVENIFL